jgi:hypothetical protein
LLWVSLVVPWNQRSPTAGYYLLMQTATCVMCQERVNLLAQKLVSVQWIESKTGTLITLPFHSDCYVRWYTETTQGGQRQTGQANQAPSGTALAAPIAPAPPQPAPPMPAEPEHHLNEDERRRLERLRGRSDSDPKPVVERSEAPGVETEHRDDQDDHAPDEEQHDDSHDVPPPDV